MKVILKESQLKKLISAILEDVASPQNPAGSDNTQPQVQPQAATPAQASQAQPQVTTPVQNNQQTSPTGQTIATDPQTIAATTGEAGWRGQRNNGNEQKIRKKSEEVQNLKTEYQSGNMSAEDVAQAVAKLGILRGFFQKILSFIFGDSASGQDSGLFGGLFGEFPSANFNPDGTWWGAVTSMGAWYQKNIHTYQGKPPGPRGRRNYKCPLLGGKIVQDDCSAFVKACLQSFNVPGIEPLGVATATMQPGSKFDKVLLAAGFKRYTYNRNNIVQGDIICGGPATHTEIYAGNGRSYSWGSVHDGINGHQGMPCKIAGTKYLWVWRYEGKNGNNTAQSV